jgi:hypothetical protein
VEVVVGVVAVVAVVAVVGGSGMSWNVTECKNLRNSLVAATFEKANTYVIAPTIIRDREVGSSNPLAPTNNSHSIN